MMTRGKTKTPQTIAFALTARSYLYVSLLFSIIGVALEMLGIYDIPSTAFGGAEAILLLVFAVRFNSMKSGEEMDDEAEDGAKEKKSKIRLLLIEIGAVAQKTKEMPSPAKESVQGDIKAVYNAILYSDPLSDDSLAECEQAIKESVGQLRKLVVEGDADAIKQLCSTIQEQVMDREERIKLLK